jgi:hypothetical protein
MANLPLGEIVGKEGLPSLHFYLELTKWQRQDTGTINLLHLAKLHHPV